MPASLFFVSLSRSRLPLFHYLHPLSHALSMFHCVHVSLAPACIRNAKGKLHYQMTFRMHLAHEKQISNSNALGLISLAGN